MKNAIGYEFTVSSKNSSVSVHMRVSEGSLESGNVNGNARKIIIEVPVSIWGCLSVVFCGIALLGLLIGSVVWLVYLFEKTHIQYLLFGGMSVMGIVALLFWIVCWYRARMASIVLNDQKAVCEALKQLMADTATSIGLKQIEVQQNGKS